MEEESLEITLEMPVRKTVLDIDSLKGIDEDTQRRLTIDVDDSKQASSEVITNDDQMIDLNLDEPTFFLFDEKGVSTSSGALISTGETTESKDKELIAAVDLGELVFEENKTKMTSIKKILLVIVMIHQYLECVVKHEKASLFSRLEARYYETTNSFVLYQQNSEYPWKTSMYSPNGSWEDMMICTTKFGNIIKQQSWLEEELDMLITICSMISICQASYIVADLDLFKDNILSPLYEAISSVILGALMARTTTTIWFLLTLIRDEINRE